MTTVLAAVDPSPVTTAVVATARGLAELVGADVEALHVIDEGTGGAEVAPAIDGVPVRTVRGPVPASLVAALEAEDVVAGVFGARAAPGGRQPAGRTALHVLGQATKPVVVVPPGGAPSRRLRRLLLPLEGTTPTSRPVHERLGPMLGQDVELVVLHVFTPATVPRGLDRPSRDLSIWGDEFAARHSPGAARVELRTGPVGPRVGEVCADCDIDLVVLSWSQDMSPGQAEVVRHVLGTSTVPVLLLPPVPEERP